MRKIQKKLGDERRERRKEGTTERGNYWNDTTSALFKNLVLLLVFVAEYVFGICMVIDVEIAILFCTLFKILIVVLC